MPVKARTPQQVFDASVVRLGLEECWAWTGKVDRWGYGRAFVHVSHTRRDWLAHRLSWMLAHGDPGTAWVLHKCDNPNCVNPNHLFLGDAQANVDDMINKGRAARQVGTMVPSAKLHESHIPEIFRMRSNGALLSDIASRFGVAAQTIDSALKRRTWRHVEVAL
jgi:HNH endonuclease